MSRLLRQRVGRSCTAYTSLLLNTFSIVILRNYFVAFIVKALGWILWSTWRWFFRYRIHEFELSQPSRTSPTHHQPPTNQRQRRQRISESDFEAKNKVQNVKEPAKFQFNLLRKMQNQPRKTMDAICATCENSQRAIGLGSAHLKVSPGRRIGLVLFCMNDTPIKKYRTFTWFAFVITIQSQRYPQICRSL